MAVDFPQAKSQGKIMIEASHNMSATQTLPAKTADFDETAAYTQIAQEIATQSMDKGLWLKALVQASGDEKQQLIAFTGLRLQQLREIHQAEALRQENEARLEQE